MYNFFSVFSCFSRFQCSIRMIEDCRIFVLLIFAHFQLHNTSNFVYCSLLLILLSFCLFSFLYYEMYIFEYSYELCSRICQKVTTSDIHIWCVLCFNIIMAVVVFEKPKKWKCGMHVCYYYYRLSTFFVCHLNDFFGCTLTWSNLTEDHTE